MWIPVMRWIGACAVVGATFSLAYAHHSIAGVYDTRREVAVEAVVTQFQFVSPHPFVLAQAIRNGVAEQWRFDMDDRNEMREIGLTAETLRTGDRVAVAGHPAREEPRRLYIQRFERPSDGFSYDIVDRRPRLRRPATR
jgi:hypothetical protein